MSDRVLDPVQIVDDALNNRLFVNLPPCFRQITKQTEQPEERGRKRPGAPLERSDDVSGLVRNKEPVREFKMKQGEDFKIYGGDNTCHRVPWGNDGKVMCPRFFLKKYCFDTCPNKSSHVAASKVSEEKKRAFLDFQKKCHGV